MEARPRGKIQAGALNLMWGTEIFMGNDKLRKEGKMGEGRQKREERAIGAFGSHNPLGHQT